MTQKGRPHQDIVIARWHSERVVAGSIRRNGGRCPRQTERRRKGLTTSSRSNPPRDSAIWKRVQSEIQLRGSVRDDLYIPGHSRSVAEIRRRDIIHSGRDREGIVAGRVCRGMRFSPMRRVSHGDESIAYRRTGNRIGHPAQESAALHHRTYRLISIDATPAVVVVRYLHLISRMNDGAGDDPLGLHQSEGRIGQ